jgi:integrase
MPRRAKGPRLWLRKRKGRPSVWVIRDRSKEVSTECGPEETDRAEEALKDYLAEKHTPSLGERDPANVLIADVLTGYAEAKAMTASGELIDYHLEPLLGFWGVKYPYLSQIKGESCREYVEWRVQQDLKSATKNPRKVTKGAAGRELDTLGGAIGWYHGENQLTSVPVVTKPAKSAPRYPWLTRSQAAQALWDARKQGRHGRHMMRFIIIGVYSGSRHATITGFRWVPTTSSGWFDVKRGVMHRRGTEEVETKKRRPPARIPDRLLAHLRRWHRMDMEDGVDFVRVVGKRREQHHAIMTHVIHYGGEPVRRVRKSFARICERIGLTDGETPHVLRHTAATWLMQGRADPWEASGYLGMSLKMLLEVYGHHHPDHQQSVSRAISRRPD